MNTALVIFAVIAALGLATATATLVIPNIPQAQAAGSPGYDCSTNPGTSHHLDHPNTHCPR